MTPSTLNVAEIMKQAAVKGGGVLRTYFGQELVVDQKKTAADLRTKADTESEALIVNELAHSFPNYNILTEEQGEINNNSQYTFIIDPLDGSNNFVMGMPYFSVAIGLMKENVMIEGVVYNPILDHLYWASAGKGMWFNDHKLQVNEVTELEQTTLSHVANYQTWPQQVSAAMQKLGHHNIKRVLNTWSPALDACLLAAGKIEALYCDVTAHDEFYDYAIGKFMAREGGAKVTTLDNLPDTEVKNGRFLASNGTIIHEELLAILKS